MKYLTSKQYRRTLAIRTIGNMLILTSLFFLVKTFYSPAISEFQYLLGRAQNIRYIVADKKTALQTPAQPPNMLKGIFDRIPTEEVIQPIDTQFGIVIPKIAANSPIVPNVDVGNEQEYLKVLEKAVAHVKGTAFPGEHGHIYLFAHSTDYFWHVGTYNAIFYLLYKLQVGDEIDLFYKGQKYKYHVQGTKIVDPSHVEYVTRKTPSEFLTLQTCWPPGTTLLRLLVFANRVAE
jgi:sortase A